MPMEPLVVVILLVVGCAAFLLWVLYCLFWVFGRAGGGFMRLIGLGPAQPPPSTTAAAATVCSNDRCQKVERRKGRYCSQCGSPLQPYHHAVDVCT